MTMAALAVSGLVARTRLWADGILTLTVFLYAVVGARVVRLTGSARAFAIAFAIFGSAYFLQQVLSPISDLLITNRLLCAIAKVLHVPEVSVNEFVSSSATSKGPRLKWDDVTLLYANDMSAGGVFLTIGHCVFSWLFALFGGWIVACGYSRREASGET